MEEPGFATELVRGGGCSCRYFLGKGGKRPSWSLKWPLFPLVPADASPWRPMDTSGPGLSALPPHCAQNWTQSRSAAFCPIIKVLNELSLPTLRWDLKGSTPSSLPESPALLVLHGDKFPSEESRCASSQAPLNKFTWKAWNFCLFRSLPSLEQH